MALQVSTLNRFFIYNGTRIPDPNPAASLDTVRDVLAQTYPEIANAAIENPKQVGGNQEYTIIRSVGTKG